MIYKLIAITFSFFAAHCFATETLQPAPPESETICSPNSCYTILQELGEGAFGKVYAVQDPSGQIYAMKFYKHYNDPDFAGISLADPQREYLNGQRFNHPNIIKSYEWFTSSAPTKEGAYLLLQYVEGHPIYQTSKGELTRKESLEASAQLIESLRYALKLGYLHLDLHGGNIMIDAYKHLMVIDLASFYSFEEMSQFVASPEKQEEPQVSPEKVPEMQAALERKHKLQRFFSENPKLHKQMQKNFAARNGDAKEDIKQDPRMAPMLSYYFDRITEVCIDMLIKSNFTREQKIALRTSIKTLAWNYTEDTEEGKRTSIDEYFNRLNRIIQSVPGPR